MAAIKSRVRVQSSGPPPLPQKKKYAGPMPPPLPHQRKAASSSPSPFSNSSPTPESISGVRALERAQSPAPESVRDDSFHGEWGLVLPKIMRASCVTGAFSTIIIRIRTIDKEPDQELLKQITEAMENDSISYVANPALAPASRDKIFVSLDLAHGLYEVFMHGVPPEQLDGSKRLVGCVAAYFHEIKERHLRPL